VSDTAAMLNLNTRMFRRSFQSGGQPGAGQDATPDSGATLPQPVNNVQLNSAVDPGTLGRRNFNNDSGTDSTTTPVPTFTIPVGMVGVTGDIAILGNSYTLKSGSVLSSDTDYQALVSTSLAAKNNLSLGSSFTAYSQTFKVVGMYDSGTAFGNNQVIVPLAVAQKLGNQTGEVSTMVLQADSIDNIAGVQTAIKNTLGADKVDLASAQQNTEDAIASLRSVQKISIAGVVIALAAAAFMVFMVMTMIVRERRREIAVLKAIGASNLKITSQFVTEAVVLTVISVVLGALIALAASPKITSMLVNSNTKSSAATATAQAGNGFGGRFGGAGPGGVRFGRPGGLGNQTQTTASLLKDVKTNIGVGFLLEGVLAVVLIGALGSAIPAFAIAKVRPAEVMRGE
jgi:putative ABC transport system permease protein